MKTYNIFIIVGIVIAILILLVSNLIYEKIETISDLNNENYLYKTILKADYDFMEVSLDSQVADNYYSEASYFYENQNYKLVGSNCRLARDYYLKESQGYKRIKAELLSKEIKDNLIDIYINLIDSNIGITNNMYEACEHFESAARYYDKYYSEVNYKESNYDMGTAEINNMNKKIKAHDKDVEDYNQYLEDFRVELERRLK